MRRAGVLAPVFSLPGLFGVGDFGACTREFIDSLSESRVRIWQVLPLNPMGLGHSPYQSYASEAGETIYIDLVSLYEEGLLASCPEPFMADSEHADYEAVREYKERFFREAFANFTPDADYEVFAAQPWVYRYAVFKVLKDHFGELSWNEWPEEYRNWIRDGKCDLSAFSKAIRYEMFLQYEFFVQWKRVKDYANSKGILIMGDIPFYVGQDSLDVWMNQEEFLLDSEGYPSFVAGVPPDYFSADGQRWGNPIYDWKHMEENGFAFWRNRLLYTARLYDMIRIDHFRAFDTYWKIPAESPTAINGEWLEAPGYKFFDRLLPEIPGTEIVAEDLGSMRPEVYMLRDYYHFPGMNVLQFTLLDPGFKQKENMIVYTGTHDNDTALGWYRSLSEGDRERVWNVILRAELLRKGLVREEQQPGQAENVPDKAASEELKIPEEDELMFPAALMRHALMSDMETCIIPWQDILQLGSEARINTPGVVSPKNWTAKMNSLSEFRRAMKYFKEAIKQAGRQS